MRNWIVALVVLSTACVSLRAGDKEIIDAVKRTQDFLEPDSSIIANSIRDLHNNMNSNRDDIKGLILENLRLKYPLPDTCTHWAISHRFTYFDTSSNIGIKKYYLPVSLRLGLRYFSHLNALTGVIGYNYGASSSLPYPKNRYLTVLLYGGTGIGDSPIVRVGSPTGPRVHMKAAYGLGVEYNIPLIFSELEEGKASQFQLFGGFNILATSPEASYKYVGNANLYGGLRFIPFQGEIVNAGIEGFGGTAYWHSNRVTSLAKNNNFFWGAGAFMNIDFDIAKAYRLPLEFSPLMSIKHDLAYGKFTIPFRASKNSSIGICVLGGRGVGGAFNGFGAIGLEWRRYTDKLNGAFNPYVGVYPGIYDVRNSSASATGTTLHLGNKFKIIDNVSVDIFGGASLWESPWLASSTGAALVAPDNYDFGAGLTFYFKPARMMDARGVTRTIRKEDLGAEMAQVGEKYTNFTSVHQRADSKIKADNVIETEVIVSEIIAPCIRVDTVVVSNPLGDVTDIKFSKVEVQDMLKLIQLGTTPLRDLSEQDTTGVLVLALFDKNRIHTERINKDNSKPNMFLHFVHINTGKVFGYYWDSTRVAQPEWRNYQTGPDIEFNPNDETKPIYFGSYQEYVRPLMWLDTATKEELGFPFPGSGAALSEILLQKMDLIGSKPNHLYDPTHQELYKIDPNNYRLAFAVYPEAVINSVTAKCGGRGFGMNIMFRFDHDKDGDDEGWPMNGHFRKVKDSNGEEYYYSEGLTDDAFFSNMIIGSEVFGLKVVIDGFALCGGGDSGDNIDFFLGTEMEKQKIKEINELITPTTKKLILAGKTDATVPKAGTCGYEELATRRAKSVKKWLEDLQKTPKENSKETVIPQHIKIELSTDQGRYSPDPQRLQPRQRCVVITAE